MGRVSDEERREVAARLRGIKDTREGCGHELCCDLWDAIFNCGYRCTDLCDECEAGVIDSLADLIDPDDAQFRDATKAVDRDVLLNLADDMDAYTECDDERCGKEMPPSVIHGYARRIREALGVTDEN